jgi:hypothetical protein
MIGQVNIILKDRHKVRGIFLTPEQQEQERLKKEEIIEKRNERRALNKAEREGWKEREEVFKNKREEDKKSAKKERKESKEREEREAREAWEKEEREEREAWEREEREKTCPIICFIKEIILRRSEISLSISKICSL